MLNESPPRSVEKRLCIMAHNAALRQLLTGLLSEWRYRLVETPAAADLLLAEEGIPLSQKDIPVLLLSRSGPEERQRLKLPIKVEKLWSILEGHFHKPPRAHIRLYRRIPVSVSVRGKRVDTAIVSLSDLGTRFDFPEELVNAEKLSMRLSLEGEPLDLEGRVIYAVPEGKEDAAFKIGMIFDRTPADVRARVGEQIICTYLEEVGKNIENWAFAEGLTCLDLPDAVAGRLQAFQRTDRG